MTKTLLKLKLLKEYDKNEIGSILEFEFEDGDKDDLMIKGLISSGTAEELSEDDDEQLKKDFEATIALHVKRELAKQVKSIVKNSKDPAGLATVHDNYEDDPYGTCKHFGTWVKEAISYKRTGKISENFQKSLNLNKALALTDAGNESIGADGGILIPDFLASEILKHGMVNAELNLMAQVSLTVVAGNSVTWSVLDNADQSSSTSRFGGVEVVWTEETGVKKKSKPKYSQLSIMLKKLVAFVPVSDELLEDVPQIQSSIQSDAGLAIIDTINQAIVDGDGNGKPTGWIGHSGTVISSTAVSRTTDALISVSNITGMYDRLINKSNAVWTINQELRSSISQLDFGGAPVMSARDLEGNPFQLLLGIPIQWTDIAKAPATIGDINLSNMRGFRLATKGGVRSAVSIHFYFDQDATVFRFVIRVNGQPAFKDTITPLNGVEKLSNFVTLAKTA